ncbi:MAG: hypothetical protein C0467_10365 [Planctomycetaceae bacterium]|nr:hypothetical protein [Planctomycetaceae bacterium]
MTVRWVVQSRVITFLGLLAIWSAAVSACVVLAVRDPEQALRHPAVTGSAAAMVGWMILAWAAMAVQRNDSARQLWTLGLTALFVHLGFAFGLAHGWSHAAAVEHVRAVGGYGEGIVVNYLFAVAWTVDVLWWWANPTSHANRPRWVAIATHGLLAFVVVNATVVFGPDERRIAYGVALIVLVAAWWRPTSV